MVAHDDSSPIPPSNPGYAHNDGYYDRGCTDNYDQPDPPVEGTGAAVGVVLRTIIVTTAGVSVVAGDLDQTCGGWAVVILCHFA
jgi:hypothetical protein